MVSLMKHLFFLAIAASGIAVIIIVPYVTNDYTELVLIFNGTFLYLFGCYKIFSYCLLRRTQSQEYIEI